MRKRQFFVPITKNKKTQLISTKRIKSIQKFIPDLEKINEHLENEVKMLELFPKYRPEPIVVESPEEDFDVILKELSNKAGFQIESKFIYLIFQSGNIPLITIKQI